MSLPDRADRFKKALGARLLGGKKKERNLEENADR